MFEFLNELMGKKKKREKVKLHFSEHMIKFMLENRIPANTMLLDFNEDCDICYVDFSEKSGYVRIMPTSKYLHALNKYMEYEDMGKDWYNNIKNQFPRFYKYNNPLLVDQSIQEMRAGRFVRSVLNINPYDVETFVIRYKFYQENLKKSFD